MIFDKIENLSIYKFTNESLNEAIKHISSTPIEEKYYGESFQKNIIEFTTLFDNEKKFEAHKRYIDIHTVLEGKEYIECVHFSELTNVSEYDDENDILFGDATTSSKLCGWLKKGYALICFPQDAHLVGAHINTAQNVKKIVFKIPY
jgi:biofilm protein TabA